MEELNRPGRSPTIGASIVPLNRMRQWWSMKLETRVFSVLLLFNVAVAISCTPEIAREADCVEECGAQCIYDGEFDYDGYRAECSTDGEMPEFCGPSTSADCVEPDFELEEATVADIHSALLSGTISCEWVVHEYKRRTLWHDLWMGDGTPPLNAFVYLNESALNTARMLDDYQRCEGELAGPLHCAPFVIKTNYASREVPLTNGSFALLEVEPNFDAFTVERLRGAGAVMLGSTAMDEFASGAQGIGGRSGKTGNAYDQSLNSGGSSAGSAVAVASNLAVAGLGTDNCSSLTIPASYNDLFTMRSSHQLVSTAGIFPSNRLDAIAGPMTRTVRDLALFFDAMARFNPHYGPHCNGEVIRSESYLDYLDPQGLQGKRIGILRALTEDPENSRYPFSGASQNVEEHYEAFFRELEDMGVVLVDDIDLDELPLGRRGSGSGYDVEKFLDDTVGEVSNYEDICDTGLYSHSVFPTKDRCLQRAGQTARQLESNVESGLELYRSNREYVESVLDELELDALLYPADRRGTPRPQYTGTNCILASVTGLPTVVVPSGHVDGLPVGMSFTARMFDEKTLFEIAYAYEQATEYRQPPEMPLLDGTPPLDLQTFNQLHYDLGWAAFEEVLRDHDRYDLTASVFADIAREVLEDYELDPLLE